jgi:hypothetical protein
MEVVSQNSDAEIAKNRAREGLRWPLRELTANLMRVARGAGNPNYIPEQLGALLDSYRAYYAAFGCGPSAFELQKALEIEKTDYAGNDLRWAREIITSGALRYIAGKLAPSLRRRIEQRLALGMDRALGPLWAIGG